MTQTNLASRLNILCSARIRLTAEQRDALKQANNRFRLAKSAPNLPGSSVRSETYTDTSALHDLTISDLCTTRESISLGIILKLQKILGVEIITRKELSNAFASYLDYNYEKEAQWDIKEP